GQAAGTGTVTLQSGFAVTLGVTPPNPIGALTFQANGTNSALTVSAGNALDISGAITFAAPSANNISETITIAGSISAGSVTMVTTTGTNRTNIISISNGGTLTVSGNIATGTAGDQITLATGTSTLNAGGAISGSVTLTANNTGSTVNYTGGSQTVYNTNYY